MQAFPDTLPYLARDVGDVSSCKNQHGEDQYGSDIQQFKFEDRAQYKAAARRQPGRLADICDGDAQRHNCNYQTGPA